MFLFFGCEACGILAPWPEMKLARPELEGDVLTTGLPGNSLPYSVNVESYIDSF